MRFTFEESELINSFLDESTLTPSQDSFIKNFAYTKEHTEDPELIELYSSIISKVKTMTEEKYNKFISELPIETLTNY
jgi:hypothetical protein